MAKEEKFVIPEMLDFETLTKIIIGYLKAQAIKEPKSYSDVANIAKVSKDNVRRNGNFLVSIGILEGKRGNYKLTFEGKAYAQAIDWGRFEEANSVLRKLLETKKLTQTIMGFVDINRPVAKERLMSQIAIITEKSKEPRFKTGIKAYVDMLVTSGLLKEDSEGKIYLGRHSELAQAPERKYPSIEVVPGAPEPSLERTYETKRSSIPITINFAIDSQTDEEHLKKLLKVIKEIFEEQ